MSKVIFSELKTMVEELHNRGLNSLSSGGHDIHPDGNYFRASSTGMCMRKAMMAYLGCETIPRPPEGSRTLFHGNQIHKWADDGVDRIVWALGGVVVRLVPYRMTCMNDLFPEGVSVQGTLDHLYLVHTDEGPKLVIVDHKSANEYAFKKYKKEGAPAHHRGQVGTYAEGVRPLLEALGLKQSDLRIFMAYISKKDLEVAIKEVDTISISSATMYWSSVAALLEQMTVDGAITNDAVLPAPEPFESWECRYCDYCASQESCAALQTFGDLKAAGVYTKDPDFYNEV